MLWYKSWLETRWRFLIGLALSLCSVAAVVLVYPRILKLIASVPALHLDGEIGRQIREATRLSREYRGYVWSQWFQKNMPELGTLFAALLGSGGPFSRGADTAVLFTLSLPVSRNRVLGTRAAAGLVQWLAVALAPSLFIPLLSPVVGERYSVEAALIHGTCVFMAGAVFFSLALLLSTVFNDVWRPLLLTLSIAVVLGIGERVFRDLSPYGVFRVMSGERYFRTGTLPWQGLIATAAIATAMLYAAATNIARRDF